jgi:hypothetical protein
LLYRFDAQPIHALKVTSVVGEQGKVVVQGGGTNHEVEVTDQRARGSEAPAFAAEDFADGFIETYRSSENELEIPGWLP